MKHDNANANANAPLLAHSASTQQNRVIIAAASRTLGQRPLRQRHVRGSPGGCADSDKSSGQVSFAHQAHQPQREACVSGSGSGSATRRLHSFTLVGLLLASRAAARLQIDGASRGRRDCSSRCRVCRTRTSSPPRTLPPRSALALTGRGTAEPQQTPVCLLLLPLLPLPLPLLRLLLLLLLLSLLLLLLLLLLQLDVALRLLAYVPGQPGRCRPRGCPCRTQALPPSLPLPLPPPLLVLLVLGLRPAFCQQLLLPSSSQLASAQRLPPPPPA